MTDTATDNPAQSQEAVIAFLGDPHSYRPVPDRVERVQTHGAHVFLAGENVYKIKRAVTYDYMDCSTLEKREALCRREFAINHATAPRIYQGVVAITREDNGALAIGGAGEPVEWAVHMSRFDEACVLENIADRGALTGPIAGNLGDTVARLHENAKIIENQDGHRLVLEIVEELARVFKELHEEFGVTARQAFDTACRRDLDLHKDLLNERARSGFVRRCHGDLHLRNIVFLEGELVPFDALEFDERLATTDIVYDLAFLLMDMLHRGLSTQANLTFNRYFAHAPSDQSLKGLALLPLFLSLRAGIRAMVTAQAARHDAEHSQTLIEDGREYLRQALQFLKKPHPCLIAVGGLSGTGKSVLAASLAPSTGAAPGALHLRSDVERKRLFNVDETTRLDSRHYSKEVSNRIYQILRDKAETALKAGHSVILDAVHQTVEERQAAAGIAATLGVDFFGLWLEADVETLIDRVQSRTGDASDADEAVVKLQVDRPIGPMDWLRVDAGGTPQETLKRALAAIDGGHLD